MRQAFQVACVVAQHGGEFLAVVKQFVKAQVAVVELVHVFERLAEHEAQENADGAAVHANQDHFFVGPAPKPQNPIIIIIISIISINYIKFKMNLDFDLQAQAAIKIGML